MRWSTWDVRIWRLWTSDSDVQSRSPFQTRHGIIYNNGILYFIFSPLQLIKKTCLFDTQYAASRSCFKRVLSIHNRSVLSLFYQSMFHTLLHFYHHEAIEMRYGGRGWPILILLKYNSWDSSQCISVTGIYYIITDHGNMYHGVQDSTKKTKYGIYIVLWILYAAVNIAVSYCETYSVILL